MSSGLAYAGQVSRWTGSWLSGPRSALEPGEDADAQQWRGQRLGLPESGPGSVAPTGRRAFALIVDCIIGGLIAGLVVHANLNDSSAMLVQNTWGIGIVLAVRTVTIGFFGFSPGMAALGIRVARLDGAALVGPVRALAHSVLTALIIPAVVWDLDNRGLHDRLLGTVVVTTR
jgi:uncharacterized RDD family membrane protein YckC